MNVHAASRPLCSNSVALASRGELRCLPHRKALHRHELFTEPLYVVLPRDHPHATTAAPIKLAVFSDERWISPPEGLTCREELLRACAAAGFDPQISSYSCTYLTTFALVAAGLGIALSSPCPTALTLPTSPCGRSRTPSPDGACSPPSAKERPTDRR